MASAVSITRRAKVPIWREAVPTREIANRAEKRAKILEDFSPLAGLAIPQIVDQISAVGKIFTFSPAESGTVKSFVLTPSGTTQVSFTGLKICLPWPQSGM